MSAANAIRFVQQIAQDGSLRARVEATRSPDDVVRIGREAGYDFTGEELRTAADTLRKDELSDSQLESVAGGGYLTDAAGAVSSTVSGAASSVAGAAGWVFSKLAW